MPEKSPPSVKRSYQRKYHIVRLRERGAPDVNIAGNKLSFGPYNIGGSERINDENLIAPDFMRPIPMRLLAAIFGVWPNRKAPNSHHRPHNNHKLCCIFTSVYLRLVVCKCAAGQFSRAANSTTNAPQPNIHAEPSTARGN